MSATARTTSPPSMRAFHVAAYANLPRVKYHTLAASAVDAAQGALARCSAKAGQVVIIVRPVKTDGHHE